MRNATSPIIERKKIFLMLVTAEFHMHTASVKQPTFLPIPPQLISPFTKKIQVSFMHSHHSPTNTTSSSLFPNQVSFHFCQGTLGTISTPPPRTANTLQCESTTQPTPNTNSTRLQKSCHKLWIFIFRYYQAVFPPVFSIYIQSQNFRTSISIIRLNIFFPRQPKRNWATYLYTQTFLCKLLETSFLPFGP